MYCKRPHRGMRISLPKRVEAYLALGHEPVHMVGAHLQQPRGLRDRVNQRLLKRVWARHQRATPATACRSHQARPDASYM
jgi:hypothetical protein